jgi:hypothetical protein
LYLRQFIDLFLRSLSRERGIPLRGRDEDCIMGYNTAGKYSGVSGYLYRTLMDVDDYNWREHLRDEKDVDKLLAEIPKLCDELEQAHVWLESMRESVRALDWKYKISVYKHTLDKPIHYSIEVNRQYSYTEAPDRTGWQNTPVVHETVRYRTQFNAQKDGKEALVKRFIEYRDTFPTAEIYISDSIKGWDSMVERVLSERQRETLVI